MEPFQKKQQSIKLLLGILAVAFGVATPLFGSQNLKKPGSRMSAGYTVVLPLKNKSHPPGNIFFESMKMTKHDADLFAYQLKGFTHFIFQNDNGNDSGNPNRVIYKLTVYSYENNVQKGPLEGVLKPYGKNKRPAAIKINFSNYKMTVDELKKVSPEGLKYAFLKFEPIECQEYFNYMCYRVYPVDENDKPVDNDLELEIFSTRIQPLNPSPPAIP